MQLTWHIPKISLLPLSMHGDTTYITHNANYDGKFSLCVKTREMSYLQSGLFLLEFSLKHGMIYLDPVRSVCLHKLWSADALTLSSC